MNMPSLLPYINPDKNSPRLIIPRISQQTTPGGQVRFPFVLISDSGSFTRIIQAQIESDGGSIIKPVFLLLDAEEYHTANEEPGMLNNVEIENCRQHAYEKYSSESSIITLADQIGADGRIRQFQSLFYCASREIFFHPPCPNCGNPLTLCKDDKLLVSGGLAPYSQSLRRYLHCAQCSGNGADSGFYASMPESTDPPTVKDLYHLIKGFGRLEGGDIDDFPCPQCPSHDECYGNKDLALSRIRPFSFYPFHLFILEAASINAFDFLSLMSGASFPELEDRLGKNRQLGRIQYVESVSRRLAQGSPFLFEQDDRHFLEILYLKLTFLGQLSRLVLSDIDSYRHPDLGFRLDRVWVTLTQEHSLLPFFWNFHTSLIDIVGSTSVPPRHAAMPPLYANYALGMLWFSVLLGNRDRNPAELNKILAKGFQADDVLNTTIAEDNIPQEYSHAFTPGNIFWNPEELFLPEKWISLWRDTLDLGWALLKSSTAGDSSLSEDDFWKAFEGLREEIRETLLQKGPETAAEGRDTSHADAIHEILTQIISKWSAAPQAPEEDMEETLILSGGTPDHAQPGQGIEGEQEKTLILQTGQQSPDKTPGIRYGDEEDVMETVILSRDEISVKHSRNIEDDIPETVIMNPDKDDHDGPASQAKADEEDFMTETIILKPDNDKG